MFFVKKLNILWTIWGVNMIRQISEVELKIILSTLVKFEHWNQTVLIMKY